jgi:hypothetical protein
MQSKVRNLTQVKPILPATVYPATQEITAMGCRNDVTEELQAFKREAGERN